MLTCIISGILIKTYWFSYILFLTFLGGLLVLFIYVSRIASNELFKTNYKLISLFLTLSLLIILTSIFININRLKLNYSHKSEIEIINFLNIFFNNDNKINLSKLYNNQTFILIIILIIYLFITLVAVVKITNIYFGPLRISN